MIFFLTSFHAHDHIDQVVDLATVDDAWQAADIDIILWMHATVCPDLVDVIMENSMSAYAAWHSIRLFFLDNQATQLLHVSKEFRTTVRGDITIAVYYARLKRLADALEDLGEPASDKALTEQMVDRLGKKFEVQAEIFQSLDPFPKFVQARGRLQLAEAAIDKKARTESVHALTIQNDSRQGCGGDRGGERGDHGRGVQPGGCGGG